MRFQGGKKKRKEKTAREINSRESEEEEEGEERKVGGDTSVKIVSNFSSRRRGVKVSARSNFKVNKIPFIVPLKLPAAPLSFNPPGSR